MCKWSDVRNPVKDHLLDRLMPILKGLCPIVWMTGNQEEFCSVLLMKCYSKEMKALPCWAGFFNLKKLYYC